jgi:hypothetical protein
MHWLRLGRLAPLVLVVWAVMDVGMRLLPPHLFRVNALLIALRSPGRHSPFQPNMSMRYDYVGDAVRDGNFAPTEVRAPLRFSTDEFGYRLNPYVPDGEEADLLVLRGFSFIYGGALSDEETLPAVLTRLAGVAAYNGARWHLDPQSRVADLDWLLSQLPVRPRRAVVVYLEHEDPRRPALGEEGIAGAAGEIHPALVRPSVFVRTQYRRVQTVRRIAGRWWEFSPLEILTRRFDRRLRNDRLLPNTLASEVRVLTMPDGRRMILRGYELEPAQRLRGRAEARHTADYFAWWRTVLAARNIDSIVLTLPTRYSVYGPHLEVGEARRRAVQSRTYLDHLHEELADRDIPYVNGAEPFFSSAAEELRTGRLSFYREDNHWNATGVERTARIVIDALAP